MLWRHRLAVEDALDGLRWAEEIGGLDELIRRTEANYAAVAAWVERTPWIDFLAKVPETRSTTSICLQFTDSWFRALSLEDQGRFAKAVAARLETEGIAYDIAAYRDAPPGLRIWGGATVETSDIEALLPWIEWAWLTLRAERS